MIGTATIVQASTLLGKKVVHRCETDSSAGLVTGMQVGINGSIEYRVQWNIDKCIWHYEDELVCL